MQLQTRTDKIKLLKNIQAGKASVNELLLSALPGKIEIWSEILPDREKVFNDKTNETLTLQEFEERRNVSNKDFNTAYVLVKSSGVPLAFDESQVSL